MATSHLIRLESVNLKETTLLKALKHNKREMEKTPANIDASRSHLNYALHGEGDAKAIDTHAKVQMLKAGIETLRKNAVIAVEVLFSLPIDRHQQDTRPFFNDCYQWTLKTFPGELLSFDVHLDESAPHAHALILPLVDGKMKGNEIMGGRGKLKCYIDMFHQQVASKHGLSKRDYKRLNAKYKQTLGREVLKRLNGDSVQKSAIYSWVRDVIMRDPLPCAELLDIEFSPAQRQAKTKSFVDIKRSHGKGSFER
jgi:hypothetical protein